MTECDIILDGLKPGLDENQGTNLFLEEMPELTHNRLTPSNLTEQSLVGLPSP